MMLKAWDHVDDEAVLEDMKRFASRKGITTVITPV